MPSPVATAVLWSADCWRTSTPVTTTGSPRTWVRNRWAANVRYPLPQPRSAIRSGSSSVGPAQVALVDRLGDRRVQDAQELLDLAVLRPAGSASSGPRGRTARAPRTPGRPPGAAGPCRGRGRARPRPPRRASAVCSSASPFLVTRTWWDCVVVSTCQLPNGSSSNASTASRASSPGSWFDVCAWRVVVRRHLEAATGLEVDVAQLHRRHRPACARGGGRTRRPGPGRRGRGSPARSWVSTRSRGWAGIFHFTRAAITTIRRRAPSASGMIRRRWRGFTCRV